jgi:hypothetical protein
MSQEQPARKPPLPVHLRFHYAGAAILAAGLAGAALIYLLTPAPGGAELADELMRRQYEFQLERMGGKALVLTTQFTQWFASLWHGQKLAYTVAALSTVAALACFWIGGRLSVYEPDDPSAQPGEGDGKSAPE